ncbi:MAG: alanine--tRNA ligase [Candidatus Harrisonbacteria bacterium CG10_big_fil_rev_8_21_14_0_10_49_15]|uniref:alanine--tRNA ligase n=1 Tax=Candidatus Harrisonbacteria bacterium CG10_big_fil_rev_8_21_14_0_10_49_15 TaxID=1974587 RepID=A0A2H0UL68_9BACT|nr:MAG: alanine--tRNA ligase [Candidatus Harrisonbacteria bacterium CG10_big_fil_rev_8_21_14_0_10_49_15]
MTSEEIRSKFLEYFKSRGHAIVPSSSLVPTDPSVLLTTAGMQQFKPYFTGELDPDKDFSSLSTASIQKCVRTDDIDEVGDSTHLTFFEMLGNFSFGGYFKKEAIAFAHEFITKELDLPISYVTIFEGSHGVPKDTESKEIWKSLGVTDIREEGIGDVFWGPTGTSGPCGPTTEIYCRNAEGVDVEIWNIVFNQFFFEGSREELISGKKPEALKPLDTPGIDTGAGFERLVTIKQGVVSPYETDIFRETFAKIEEFSQGIKPQVARIFADHFRASVFLIADGVRPSNKEAGYIVRRLIRRMLAHKVTHDIHGDIFTALFPIISQKFGMYYPEVKDPEILHVLQEESAKFELAVVTGIGELKRLSATSHQLSASQAFMISSTYGLNFELMREIAPEATRGVTQEAFEAEFKQHQEISRAGMEKKFGGHGLLLDTGELKAKDEEELKIVTRLHTATHLMQAALRKVLGDEVRQAGSDITAERTRFDFQFGRKVTADELAKVEGLVNEVVSQDLPMQYQEMSKQEAVQTGALHFFIDRYPETVKVYYAGHSLDSAFSKEFCGGPHVTHTGEIGKFRIKKESSVGTGVRRIKAVVE